MSKNKLLTKAEEEIMHYFWNLGAATVTEIIEQMEGQKPPHSSVSTIVRILEKKGFVTHEPHGRTFKYFTTLSKEEYSNLSIGKLIDNYFDGSAKNLVSFIAKEKNIDLKEFSELLKLLEE